MARGTFRRKFRVGAIATGLGLLVAALNPVAPFGVPVDASQTAATPGAAPIESVQLSLLGSSNLASAGLDGQVKPRGQNGEVAVLDRTAFVAAGPIFHGAASTTGRICTDHGGVKVVDLTNPVQPTLVSTITMEDTKGAATRAGVKFNNVSVTASALDARSVTTATAGFAGDVLAIATQRCESSFFSGARVEFWDVTNRATPVMIGIFDPADIPFTPPGGVATTGQWGIFEDVRMFVKDNKLMAMATTPFSIGNAGLASPFGDFRLIDLSDIRKPKQVGIFPPVSIGQSSVNGCRTFQAGKAAAPTPDGKGAILSWYDGTNVLSTDTSAAVFKLDLDNLPAYVAGSAPPAFNPAPPFWGYPYDANVEGNASDVQPFLDSSGNLQVLTSEDDLDPARSTVSIGPAGGVQQEFRGCTILAGKHLYEYPGQQIAADLVYVGRSCPVSTLAGTRNTVADELLANPAGKIALVEGGGNQFDGCSAVEKLDRLKAAGAVALIQSSGAETLNTLISGPRGGIPGLPYLTIPASAYNGVQLVPNSVAAALSTTVGAANFPTSWERTSTTNVTGAAFPSRVDRSRYRNVADATDRVARAQVNTANRFNVIAGQAYNAGVFLEVEAITGGAFRAATVWYDAAGAVISESQVANLTAVTARTRSDAVVTAPVGAVKGTVKVEWTGADAAAGTAYADTFSMARVGLQSTMKDNQGQWGAQRIINFSATPPTEVGSYRSPTSKMWPPPNDGLFAPRSAKMFGADLAFSTWLSDGLRVVDLSNPASPREVASFVPPVVADPTVAAGAGGGLIRGPVWGNRTLVAGVDVIPTGDSSGLVVVSDINAGLYVLGFRLQRAGELAPGAATTTGPGGNVTVIGSGYVPGTTVRLSIGGTNLGTATADAAGSLSTTVTVPLELPPGSYRIEATGAVPGSGEKTLTFNLTVPSMGYWTVAADGGVFSFGTAGFSGSLGGVSLNSPIVGVAATPTGNGYWQVAADGGIFSFGDAKFFGSTGGSRLNKPIVGMAATPSGAGYWLVASDGGIFSFGDATFKGSTGGIPLNNPIVGMSATPSGAGYWLVASDGGIFAFGDATFFGSTGQVRLTSPVVGIAGTPTGSGYWLVAADGGIFAFGAAPFFGSVGGTPLNSPIVGMAASPPGSGYWMAAGDGGIFAFGNAQFAGSIGSTKLRSPIVGIARFPRSS